VISIFTSPKPFVGKTAVRQMNAIGSWKALHPDVEIVLFGDEPGSSEAARRLGITHVPEVGRNDYGTPLVSSMFSAMDKGGRFEVQAYVNADIILKADLRRLTTLINRTGCLMIGSRWDVTFDEAIDFSDPGWDATLERFVTEFGKLHPPKGSDYFIYPRGMFVRLPELAVGRIGWDNWVIYDCRRRRVPVVDATETVQAIHLDHDYSHLTTERASIETRRNQDIVGHPDHMFTLEHANWKITKRGLRRSIFGGGIILSMRTFLILRPKLAWIRIVLRNCRAHLQKAWAR
jgi:hypothetical protein